MPGTGWANLLVPLFRCYQSTHDVFFQSDQFWTSSYYLGMGTLALGVVACWQVRNRRVGLLAITTGLTLVLALGDQGFLYAWLRKIIPEMSFMRFPIKFVVLTSFCVPLLADFAVGYRRHQAILHNWSGYAAYLIVATILAVIVAIIIWFDYRFPLFPNMGYWPGTWRNGLSRILFLGAILGIVWLLQKPTNTRLTWLASVALLISIFLDGLTHAPRQNPTVPRTAFDPGLVKLSPHPRLGESRAMISPSANRVLFQTTTSDTLNDYICRRLSLFSNCNLLDGIPKINGFYPLFLHRMDDVRVMVYDTSKEPLPPLYDFLGVSQITAPRKFFEWESRTNYLAWATVGQEPSFVGEAAALHAISSTNFNPRRAVYLPPEAKPFIHVTQATRASIISSRFSAHRIEISVKADQPSLLVVSQVYFPSWRAWVDAKGTHLWTANYAFQALEIPEGKHHVTLVYRDRSFFLGTIISIATLVACVIVWRGRTHCTGT
jgi:hypothetical protein